MAIKKKAQTRRTKPFKSLIKQVPFKLADGFRARLKGIMDTADKAVDSETPTTTDIDYCVSEERWINGVGMVLKNHDFEDVITFQVVDKDGVGVALGWYTQGQFDAMGEYVADTFGENWNVISDSQAQQPVILQYPARIEAGLYIRLKYVANNTTDDVRVNANFFFHKKS